MCRLQCVFQSCGRETGISLIFQSDHNFSQGSLSSAQRSFAPFGVGPGDERGRERGGLGNG